MTAVRAIVLLFLTGVLSTPVSFQSSVAVLSGRVVDGGSGKPVRGASVKIVGDKSYAPIVLTQGDGRFQFSDVPPGSIEIVASKPGFFSGGYGQRRASSDHIPILIRERERVDNLEIRVWPAATISGRVTDDEGTPLSSVKVQAALAADVELNGWPSAPLTAITDDRGNYSIGRLAPGQYIVGIILKYQNDPDYVAPTPALFARPPGAPGPIIVGRQPLAVNARVQTVAGLPGNSVTVSSDLPTEIFRGGRRYAFSSTFFPAASMLAQAAAVPVATGEEHGGVDLTLRLMPAVAISGRIVDAAGSAGGALLSLNGVNEITTHALPDGQFTFPVVTPGVYELNVLIDSARMHPPPPDLLPNERRWARQTVVVGDRDITALAVSLRPGIVLRGRIDVDGPVPAGVMAAIDGAVYGTGQIGSTSPLQISPDGTFVSAPLPPGEFHIGLSSLPDGWLLGGVEVRGRDHSGAPIEASEDVDGVVLRVFQQQGSIAGTVRIEGDGRGDLAVVVLFPADSQGWGAGGNWTLKTHRSRARNGTFAFNGLGPGAYLLAAVDDLELDDWPSSAAMARLAARATPVTLLSGARVEQQLIARIK